MPYWMAPTYQQNQQTTAPCLLKLFASCWEIVTSSKLAIAGNLSRDKNRMSSRLPASKLASAPSNSSIASGVPHAELAAVIASVVDKRINRQLIQDGGTSNVSNAQLARPSPPSNLQDSLRSSPPPQDGGQNTTRQQQPSVQNPPTGYLPNTAISSGLAASSGLGSLSSPVDFSDPAQVESLHPNFR